MIKDFLYERWTMMKASLLFIFQRENFITLSWLLYIPMWWHIMKWTGLLQGYTLVDVLSLTIPISVWVVVTLIFVLTLISCNITYQGWELFGLKKKLEDEDER